MINKTERRRLLKSLYQELQTKIWALQKQSGLEPKEFFLKCGLSEKTFCTKKLTHFRLGILQQIQYLLSLYDLCLKIEFVPFKDEK
ncbi:MAG: hypothetical protein IJS26_02770 [Alphaproteobacteria bacterium]|nr:hypothetical protein [Alphaproteobacteria bacterium]